MQPDKLAEWTGALYCEITTSRKNEHVLRIKEFRVVALRPGGRHEASVLQSVVMIMMTTTETKRR
jgi:hypothetical protein